MVNWGLTGQLVCLRSGRCWGGSTLLFKVAHWAPGQAKSSLASLGTHPVARGHALQGAFRMRDATPDVRQASPGTSRNQKPASCTENAGNSPTLMKIIFFLAQGP